MSFLRYLSPLHRLALVVRLLGRGGRWIGRRLRPVGRLLATWRGRFIAAWLVVQIALPLVYYTVRRDPHDERFAWRMFSPMRMVRCEPGVHRRRSTVRLNQRFHTAWINIARRGRFDVVEAMAARLCHDIPTSGSACR